MRTFIFILSFLLIGACTYNKDLKESFTITAVDQDTGVKTTYTATSQGEQLKLSILDDVLTPTSKFLSSTEGTISRLAVKSGLAKAVEAPASMITGLTGGLAGNRPLNVNVAIDESKLATAIMKASALVSQSGQKTPAKNTEMTVNNQQQSVQPLSREEIQMLRALIETLKANAADAAKNNNR